MQKESDVDIDKVFMVVINWFLFFSKRFGNTLTFFMLSFKKIYELCNSVCFSLIPRETLFELFKVKYVQ